MLMNKQIKTDTATASLHVTTPSRASPPRVPGLVPISRSHLVPTTLVSEGPGTARSSGLLPGCVRLAQEGQRCHGSVTFPGAP